MRIMEFIKKRYVDVPSLLASNCLPYGAFIYLNPLNYREMRQKGIPETDVFYRVDGIYMVSILRLLFGRSMRFQRQSFDMTSLAPLIFRKCQEEGLKIYVAGGKEGEAEDFTSKISENFPNLKWVGSCDGYRDVQDIVACVSEASADVVLLGLGNGKQELVAMELSSKMKGRFFACGAFITQTSMSKSSRYYPPLIDFMNLRWAYRFYNEPHVFKRVIKYYPSFFFLILKDLLSNVSKS